MIFLKQKFDKFDDFFGQQPIIQLTGDGMRYFKSKSRTKQKNHCLQNCDQQPDNIEKAQDYIDIIA